MNSDRKLAWRFLGELAGGGILFAACLLALLQAPYWNPPKSLDEMRIERTLKLSRGNAPYHVFMGNSLLFRAVDLSMMENATCVKNSVIRAPGARVHDMFFAIEDLLESDNPPERIYLQAGLMRVTNEPRQMWSGGTWGSFGRLWPQSWNKMKAAFDHLDWQQDAFDLIHPKLSELTEFERFGPEFVESIFSVPTKVQPTDSLSFFPLRWSRSDCLAEDYPLDSIIAVDPRKYVPPPPGHFEEIFSRLNRLAMAANTEIFWLTIPKLEGMDTHNPALMAVLREACQTYSWTLIHLASNKRLKQHPEFYQNLPEITNKTNLHLCPEGRIAFTEELIRRLKSADRLRRTASK